MKFWTLEPASAGWGDYGRIAVHGMSTHLGRNAAGELRLERTGPHVPPLTLPGISDAVATRGFREELEASGLVGLSFRPIEKARIVRVDWAGWPPDRVPDTVKGEPEHLLLGRRHDPALAESIGPLWEIVLPFAAVVERRPRSKRVWEDEIFLNADRWEGADLFRARGAGARYVSERGRRWLESRVAPWATFRECRVVSPAT